MLPSGNDAALALAKWGGNRLGNKSTPVKRFIQEMNYYARKLDLSNTQFSNPHGLPSHNSGSTSEDIAQLVGHCLN
jgi:D-alanyl-D-alanine carboxypeptidase (penicillin-binding protein 5/6)